MAFFRKIKAGLVKDDITSFVGEEGNIFFNVETGELRLSDGVTPGGIPIIGVGGATVSETEPNNPNEGDIWYKESTNELSVFGGTWSAISGGGGGARGFTGSAGTNGYTGSQGNLGYTGSAGTNGYTGSQGSQGELGYTGSQGGIGYTGSAGLVQGLTSDGVNIITVDSGYSIIPATDGLQNLGSPTNRFGTIYVGSNSIDIGGTVLSIDPTDGALKVTLSSGNLQYVKAEGLIFPDGTLQNTKAPRMYTNADAANGLTIEDLIPGDFYYDDGTESIFIMVDTGLGYNSLLDLTVRAQG